MNTCKRTGGEHDFKRVEFPGDIARTGRLCPFCGLLQVRDGDPPAKFDVPLLMFLGDISKIEMAVVETSLDLSHLE